MKNGIFQRYGDEYRINNMSRGFFVKEQKDGIMNNIGESGENLACEYLRGLGYDIIERNYHSRYGEIDIIAHKKGEEDFIFVEVKTRSGNSGNNEIKPCEYVDEKKRRRIIRTALVYLSDRVYSVAMRFDVIDIIFEKGVPLIKHYENAFTGEYI